MSLEALAMAEVNCNKCRISFKEWNRRILGSHTPTPSYLLANGRTEEQQYQNFCRELDLAIRGFSPHRSPKFTDLAVGFGFKARLLGWASQIQNALPTFRNIFLKLFFFCKGGNEKHAANSCPP
ncbi:hypothetical protein OWV82_024601 [Melia azedarach]|uniref:Uncharacterized protein n=1 Tax=Melia azedarach TaxID=155640 RepID=A0ACC1WQN0_MELAZ|nr:hypothetical protein OWV82_024601 [Melia azedarach]